MGQQWSYMRDYRLPIPELKKIEPILTEYFGYKRAMFENELLATYYHEYPNGISEDICKNYMTDHSFLNTIAVDNGVFDYKRYAPKSTSTSKAFNPSSFIMDSEHNILVTLPSNNMLERLIDLLQKHGETDNDSVIGISLLVVAAIYEKYKNGELYTEVTISGTSPSRDVKAIWVAEYQEILTFQEEGAKGIQSYNHW